MVMINSAARYAIANLRSINDELNTTQNRISSGLRVASAKDDATVWSAAQTIRTDLKTHAAVDKSLTTAKANIDAASSANDAIASALSNLGAKITAYAASGAAQTAWDAVADAQAILTAATNFSGGVNLINNTTAYSYASSVGASGATVNTSFTPVDVVSPATATALGGANTLATFLTTFTKAQYDATTNSSANAAAVQTKLTAAVAAVSGYTSTLAAASDRITTQQSMNKALMSAKETSLSSLVDADLEEESAKLQALQVKQQLAYQALGIANQSGQNILRLFQ